MIWNDCSRLKDRIISAEYRFMPAHRKFEDCYVVRNSHWCWQNSIPCKYQGRSAARYAYERDVRPLPKEERLIRQCSEPSCVLPEHHIPLLVSGDSERVCGRCAESKSATDFGKYRHICRKCRDDPDRQRANARNRARRLRQLALDYYGRTCACCGETGEVFLVMDHIENDGAKHRKDMGGSHIYQWLYSHDYPSGFQTLCHNCNFAKSRGECPHQTQGKSKCVRRPMT